MNAETAAAFFEAMMGQSRWAILCCVPHQYTKLVQKGAWLLSGSAV